MKQHHLALTIQNEEEVHQFYENVLDFQIIKTFELEEELAYKIFNIPAHFTDTVEGELENSDRGYKIAGSCI